MAKNNARDINTERLYNLLMPSSDAPEAIPYNAQPEPEEAVEEAPAATPGGGRLDALRERMAGTAALPALDSAGGSYVLINLTEALVAERLDAAFDKFNCCKCDKCTKRAAANALNALPPRYTVVRTDKVEAALNGAPAKEAAAAVVRAVLQIKATPEH